MTNIKDSITRIKTAASYYEPDTKTVELLKDIILVSLVGPSATGKTTIMRAAAQMDPAFGRIVSFTTRERRDDEESDTYEFLKQDVQTVDKLLQQIERHELVQFTVHPTTDHVYGSHITAYNKPYMMLDTVPGAFDGLYKLPLKEIKKIALAVEPNEWRRRFDGRQKHTTKDDMLKRMSEGIQNISWALEQGNKIQWIDNSHRSVAETTKHFIAVVTGNDSADPTARDVGRGLLAEMQNMQNELMRQDG